jgi:acyl-CoA dehydrogenase
VSQQGDPVADVIRAVLADAWDRGDTPEQQAATVQRARELGWHLLGVDEASGGVGGDLGDRLRLAELLGAHGCDGPYLECNTALALLAGLDLVDRDALQAGEVAVVRADDFAAPTGRAYLDAVGEVGQVVVATDGGLHRARPDADSMAGPGGIRLVGLTLDPAPLAAEVDLAAAVRADLDLLRCARLAGAIAAVARSSARHAVEREQFGRPLIRFQAVAAMVAEQRAAAELAAAAVEAAATATATATDPSRAPLGDSAVRVCTELAGEVARLAHQVHGAMGTTHEHHLHRLTRRLWSWRDQLGAGQARARRLGSWAAEAGEAALWDALTPGAGR